MDRVLGLSLTPQQARWVLVDGVTGEGATVEHGVCALPDDTDALPATGADLHVVGLVCAAGAEPAAAALRRVLAARGAPVVTVSDTEAAAALAAGIADRARHDFLVVCTVEPEATVVATVTGQRVATQRMATADPVPLVDRVGALLRGMRPSPDAVFVLGSADPDALAAGLQQLTTRPVLTATEGQFALVRGAAMVAARTIAVPDAVVLTPASTRVRVASAVLAAAAVVLTVALSLAVVPRAEGPAGPSPARAVVAPPSVAAPAAPSSAPAAPDASAAPPVYAPRLAASISVAPAAPPAPPRLRDRVLDKIPGLNRFR